MVLATNVTFGQTPKSSHRQKFQQLEINAGVSLFAPISKDIVWDDKAWGQRVQFVKVKNNQLAYVLNLGLQQGKQLQIPVLMNLRHFMYKRVYVTYGAGATFLKNEDARFTLTAGWGVQMKRLVIEQSLFRTTAGKDMDKTHYNNLGVTVFYRL